MHWDGFNWTAVAWNYAFTGVAPISANDVWAVGYTSGVADRPLAMHWDGTRWTVEDMPGAPTKPLASVRDGAWGVV